MQYYSTIWSFAYNDSWYRPTVLPIIINFLIRLCLSKMGHQTITSELNHHYPSNPHEKKRWKKQSWIWFSVFWSDRECVNLPGESRFATIRKALMPTVNLHLSTQSRHPFPILTCSTSSVSPIPFLPFDIGRCHCRLSMFQDATIFLSYFFER